METTTLDAVLAAAYLPALGGATTGLNALCTADVLQGLRLRRKAAGVGTVTRYDLDGAMVTNTWAVLESRAYWDLETQELVIESDTPFAGDIFVNGSGTGGAYGGGTYTLPVATQNILGGVKVGDGLSMAPDGTLSVDTADEAEVNEMLTEAFAPGNK